MKAVHLFAWHCTVHLYLLSRLNMHWNLTPCLLGNFACFLSSADFFSKSTFSKKSFGNTIRISNSLDPDCRAWSGSKLFSNVNSRRHLYEKRKVFFSTLVALFDKKSKWHQLKDCPSFELPRSQWKLIFCIYKNTEGDTKMFNIILFELRSAIPVNKFSVIAFIGCIHIFDLYSVCA